MWGGNGDDFRRLKSTCVPIASIVAASLPVSSFDMKCNIWNRLSERAIARVRTGHLLPHADLVEISDVRLERESRRVALLEILGRETNLVPDLHQGARK